MIVEVLYPDGQVRRHEITRPEGFLGRSRDADVSLPDVTQLEPFHLMFSPRSDGCWVSIAKGTRVPVLLADQPFERGLVPWGAELDLGVLTIRVHPTEAEGRRSSQLRLLAAVAVIGGAGLSWLIDAPSDRPPPRQVDPPALFGVVPGCPASGEMARRQAETALDVAIAKIDRYPYDGSDGIETAGLLGLAERCFTAAGEEPEAQQAHRERALIVERIDEDYRVTHLRLLRALEVGSLLEISRYSRMLARLVAHRPGPYREWLAELQRYVEAKREEELQKEQKDNDEMQKS